MLHFAHKSLLITLILAVSSLVACDKGASSASSDQESKSSPTEHAADEHAADEHAADEHAADEHAADEHAADEHAADEHAADEHAAKSPKSLDELPEGVNVVQHEMRLLNDAMIGVLTLIVNNQLDGIPAQIHKVHSARDLTHTALTQGLYKTPKNPDDTAGFAKLDDAFHDDLKALIAASKKNDLKLATKTYGDLVQGCTNCHTQYRF